MGNVLIPKNKVNGVTTTGGKMTFEATLSKEINKTGINPRFEEDVQEKQHDDGLGEPKPTRMSLKLADRSIQYPRGIVENVFIKVDKFVLPIDFVILDMPEDSRIPIILGRPFLATARVMIDAFNKKVTLRVGDDDVIFNMDQSIKKSPTKDDECHGIDDFDDATNIETQKLLENDQLDPFLLKGLEKSINQSDITHQF
nr:hypothetical protein [Tanacetum cinerariifolium]